MLKARIITALFLAAGLLATLFLLPAAGSLLVFTLIVALAAWEWAGLLQMKSVHRIAYGVSTVLPCLALYAMEMPHAWLLGLWMVAALFWLLLVPVWFRQRWPLRANVVGLLLGWLLLLPSWAGMMTLQGHGPLWLLAAMGLVWMADIAAYFTGRACGRHKLAPTISPGKTWEGAAGAVVGVLMYGLLLGTFSGRLAGMSLPQTGMALFGLLLLTAVSILGDLFESMVKRQSGLKDSSALLPGHGGVLDRIDSLTSTLPLAGLAVYLLS